MNGVLSVSILKGELVIRCWMSTGRARRISQTNGDRLDCLGPDDWSCTILARAVAAHVGLGRGCVRTTESLLLRLAKLAAGFHHEDALEAVSHGWEALNSLQRRVC